VRTTTYEANIVMFYQSLVKDNLFVIKAYFVEWSGDNESHKVAALFQAIIYVKYSNWLQFDGKGQWTFLNVFYF
jgi:hypothetical protein